MPLPFSLETILSNIGFHSFPNHAALPNHFTLRIAYMGNHMIRSQMFLYDRFAVI